MKKYIDTHIEQIYNYFKVGNPDLLNLDEQFREIKLLDLDSNEKIKRKRQLVMNSCDNERFIKIREYIEYHVPEDKLIFQRNLPGRCALDAIQTPLEENFNQEQIDFYINLLANENLRIAYEDAITAVKKNFSKEQIEKIIRLQQYGFKDTWSAWAFRAIDENFSDEKISKMIDLYETGYRMGM
jgi:hypothetical protein